MEKLFNSKLNNREFAFNPANWERMEAILDQKAAVGRGYFWRSAAAIVLFGVIVASIIYVNPGTISQYDGITGPDFTPKGMEFPNFERGAAPPASSANADMVAFEGEHETNNTFEVYGSAGANAQNTNPGSIYSTGQNTPATIAKASDNTGGTNEISGQGALSNKPGPANEINEFANPISFIELSSKGYVLPELAALNFSLKEDDFTGYDQPVPLQPNKFTSGLFLNIGPVFTGSNTYNTLGTGFIAGVGYRKALNYGLGVETGLNYFVLNNVNIQSKSDSVFYKFGRERVETEELNSRLDYLEIPLNLTYRVAPKHQLGVGGYAATLLNVERDITKTTYTPKSGTIVEDDKASGYLDEFNRFDFGVSAFYRYSVSSRLNIGLHFKQGLVDITHDVAEGYAQQHTNFNTRIVLEYSLF